MAYPKVTIVGAGNVGATAGMILAMKDIADVVLCDVVEGMPQGKALDMMHMRSNEKYGTTITGTNDYADTANSDVVVITAGIARKPGMTREDLIGINSKIMLDVIGKAKAASPNAIFICVTNPLDVMTYLAFKNAGVPKNRLMGMGGVLDSARYAFAIAETTGASAGLGMRVQALNSSFDTQPMMLYIIVIGVIGMLAEKILKFFERRLTSWQEKREI